MIFSMMLTVKNRVQMGDLCGQSLSVEWAVTRQGCSHPHPATHGRHPPASGNGPASAGNAVCWVKGNS